MGGFKLFNFTHQLLELSTRVRAARHEVLSANVANADTPGFRPRDLDFQSVMRSAVESKDATVGASAPRIGALVAPPLDMESMIYEPEFPDTRHGEDRLDGNSVSIDRQMSLLTENSLAYETSLALLSRALAGLRYAIGEGRR